MTKAPLTFFRVFDLAFFAPGTVLVASLYVATAQSEGYNGVGQVGGQALTTAGGLVTLLGGVALVYVAGLVMHGLTFTVLRRVYLWLSRLAWVRWLVKLPGGGPDGPSLPLVFDASTRTDLVLYFWYLRATCWNVATALGISFVMILARALSVPTCFTKLDVVLLIVTLLCSLVLIFLGNSYHGAFSETRIFLQQEKGFSA